LQTITDIWLARHTAEKTLPIVEKVLKAAKEEFADAASQIFAVGCKWNTISLSLIIPENMVQIFFW